MRRVILIAIALGVPLLWAFAPDGEDMGNFAPKTFASTTYKTCREVIEAGVGMRSEDAPIPILFLGLLAPLYPAAAAILLLAAPRWIAARRRWVWLVQGIVLLPLSGVALFWALFSLSNFGWGAAAPPALYPPLWLLPGLTALAGIGAILVGIAPRGRIVRIVLQHPANSTR